MLQTFFNIFNTLFMYYVQRTKYKYSFLEIKNHNLDDSFSKMGINSNHYDVGGKTIISI